MALTQIRMPIARGRALGNAIISYLDGGFGDIRASLSLVTLNWAKAMNDPATSYPANPYTMCNRILLRMMTQDVNPGPPQGGQAQDATYKFSLYYHKRQNIGEDHQVLLIDDVEIICNSMMQYKMFPPEIEAVAGWLNWKAWPVTFIIHNEMHHDFDDPNLRISVAEINYTLEGRLASYKKPEIV